VTVISSKIGPSAIPDPILCCLAARSGRSFENIGQGDKRDQVDTIWRTRILEAANMRGHREPDPQAFARCGEMQALCSRVIARCCYFELHKANKPEEGRLVPHLTISKPRLSTPHNAAMLNATGTEAALNG
jgi:hypothetical protein